MQNQRESDMFTTICDLYSLILERYLFSWFSTIPIKVTYTGEQKLRTGWYF